MLLESQVLLEEQGGSGNREEGASQKLQAKVGMNGFKGFAEVGSRQPPRVF